MQVSLNKYLNLNKHRSRTLTRFGENKGPGTCLTVVSRLIHHTCPELVVQQAVFDILWYLVLRENVNFLAAYENSNSFLIAYKYVF